MTNGIDQPLYFVECDFGKLGRSFVEIDRDSNSRKQVIESIAAGEWRDVVTVLECNPVERTCRDVTEEICAEASYANAVAAIDDVLGIDHQAARFDHAQDHRKNWVA